MCICRVCLCVLLMVVVYSRCGGIWWWFVVGCRGTWHPRASLSRLKTMYQTPVITMACTFMAGLERPDRNLVSSVMLIAAGVAAASFGEINLSLVGIGFMLCSELFESVRLVMTQLLLQDQEFNASACTTILM